MTSPTGRAIARRRHIAFLAATGLALATFAGPARASAGPVASPLHPIPAASAFATDNPEPAPAPAAPPAQVAEGLPPAAQAAQAIEAKYEADAQPVAAKVNALAAEQGPLNTRAGNAQTTEANLAAQFADVQTRTNTLNGQADTLNNAIAAHNAQPHQFQLPAQASQLAIYNRDQANLQAQQSSLLNQFSILTTQTNQLQGAKAQADATVAQVNADIQTHNAGVAAARVQVSNLAAERQADLVQIAGLLQNYLAGMQNAGGSGAPLSSPLATAGGDQSAPPAALAAPPQARALPSSGGDQPAPLVAGSYRPAVNAPTGTASGAQQGGTAAGQTAEAPAPLTLAPVAATMTPPTLAALPPAKTANLPLTQTFGGLEPEPSGNYAVLILPPAPGAQTPPAQKAFADVLTNGGKATTYVNGKPVTIDNAVPLVAAPLVNQGGDTARPKVASPPAAASPWVAAPPVSINALQNLLNQRGLGKLANQYDLEYAPVLLDVNGNPTYGVTPTDGQGNPEIGAGGKPILRFSNLGLQNPGVAVNTFQNGVDNAPCPQHSFSGGTRVLMADGSTKPIAELKAGDLVENAEPGGGTEVHRVDQVHVTTTDTDFVDLTVADAAPGDAGTITGTANHPYYDASTAGFVDAGALRAGDRLQSGAGDSATVGSVRSHVGPLVTYDLTIDGLHTYFVVAGVTPVLVHNCGTGPSGIIDLDKASASGKVLRKGKYSQAGRSLQEHSNRPGTGPNWPQPSGKQNPDAWNAAGQELLDDILTNPNSVAHLGRGRINGIYQDTIDVRLPDGRGARFDYYDNFSGFLD